jgi:hypothetical protein
MKNRNTQLVIISVVLAFALAPIVQSAPTPDGGPIRISANEAPSPDGGPTKLAANDRVNAANEANSAYSVGPEPAQSAVVTIHSTDNVTRGKTGSFVLNMSPALMLGGLYVNFSVSGTAIEGVDYVALVSPAYIGQSGYGVIQIQTLPDPRGSSIRKAYSVVITLKDGAGYSVGVPSSATMWIKP